VKIFNKKFHDICLSYYFKRPLCKIRSKADFKSKSQNIWQQIILSSRTVMQMICTWPKIWTLSGRLSLMRTVQLMIIKLSIKWKYLIKNSTIFAFHITLKDHFVVPYFYGRQYHEEWVSQISDSAWDPVHAGDKALTRETPAKRGRVNRYDIETRSVVLYLSFSLHWFDWPWR
jgi:hypothetical protein